MEPEWISDEQFQFLLNSPGPMEPCPQGWTEARFAACQPVFTALFRRLTKVPRRVEIHCRWVPWLVRSGCPPVEVLPQCVVTGEQAAQVLSSLEVSSIKAEDLRRWLLMTKVRCRDIPLSAILKDVDGTEPLPVIVAVCARHATDDGRGFAEFLAKLPPDFDFTRMGGTAWAQVRQSLGPSALASITARLQQDQPVPKGVVRLVAERYVLGEGSISRALTVARTLPEGPRYQLFTEAFRAAATYDALIATKSLPGEDLVDERCAAIEGIVQGLNAEPERKLWKAELDRLRAAADSK